MPSTSVAKVKMCERREEMDGVHQLTFLFEKNSTFCNNYWYITIYVAFALFVRERNGNICVFDADF